jgi:hypothetical protein
LKISIRRLLTTGLTCAGVVAMGACEFDYASPTPDPSSSPSVRPSPNPSPNPSSSPTNAPGTVWTGPPGSASYIPLKSISQFAGTGPSALTYYAGLNLYANETQIVKDGLGSDLIGFMPDPAGEVFAFVSQDNGGSWSWVDTQIKFPNWGAYAWSSGMTQDALGSIHIIACQTWANPNYYRIVLSRDSNKHIQGYALEASFQLSDISGTAADHGHLLAGTDLLNNPVLFYSIYDNSRNIRIGVTRAAGLKPNSASDFLGLTGGAITTISLPLNPGYPDAHNSDMHFAQHPISRDLWLQWGAMDTADDSTNGAPLTRRRYVPSLGAGATTSWSTAFTTVVHSNPNNEAINAQALTMAVTPNYVWFLRGGGSGGTPIAGAVGGMEIDRADKDGQVTYQALPEVASTDYLGWFGLTVDPVTENRAYVMGWISPDSAAAVAQNSLMVKYWNGVAWQDFSSQEPRSTKDRFPWGMAFSSGWGAGLSTLFVDYVIAPDGTGGTYAPAVSTLRGN